MSFQAIRFYYIYAPADLGQYHWDGHFTGLVGVANTGNAVADMLVDQENYATISVSPNVNDAQWYEAGYVQDDWRLTPKLTLNLGVRYDYFQPYKENSGQQSNFIVTGPLGIGTGSGVLQFPESQRNIVLGAPLPQCAGQGQCQVQFVSNDRLVTSQKTDFAPRVGIAYYATARHCRPRGLWNLLRWAAVAKATATSAPIFPGRTTRASLLSNLRYGQLPFACRAGRYTPGWLAAGDQRRTVADIYLTAWLPLHRSEIKPPYTMTFSLGLAAADASQLRLHTDLCGQSYAPPGTLWSSQHRAWSVAARHQHQSV